MKKRRKTRARMSKMQAYKITMNPYPTIRSHAMKPLEITSTYQSQRNIHGEHKYTGAKI